MIVVVVVVVEGGRAMLLDVGGKKARLAQTNEHRRRKRQCFPAIIRYGSRYDSDFAKAFLLWLHFVTPHLAFLVEGILFY